MSDGINICFGNVDLACPEPESIASLLSSARFRVPNTEERVNPQVLAEHLTKESAADLLAFSSRHQARLEFIDSSYEYFSLSFFSLSETSDCVLLSTNTRTQTKNTLEKLALCGFTLLDLVVAIAECFVADSFAETRIWKPS